MATQADSTVKEVIESICLARQSQLISPSIASLPCPIRMHGKHQIDNAKTAYTLAQVLKEKFPTINERSIIEGLSSISLSGRFEIINDNIILDAAHNGDSALALVQTLEAVFPNRPVVFIIGLNQDKNVEEFFLALKNKAKKIVATRSNNHRALSPKEIHKRIIACDTTVEIVSKDNMREALLQPKTDLGGDNVLCICGSFYLVAEAREILIEQRKVTAIAPLG